jgi:hypothetical protein
LSPARISGKTPNTDNTRSRAQSRRERRRRCRGATADQQVVEVKPGTVIVRAEVPEDATEKPDRWYVLEDRPALLGDDITDP